MRSTPRREAERLICSHGLRLLLRHLLRRWRDGVGARRWEEARKRLLRLVHSHALRQTWAAWATLAARQADVAVWYQSIRLAALGCSFERWRDWNEEQAVSSASEVRGLLWV